MWAPESQAGTGPQPLRVAGCQQYDAPEAGRLYTSFAVPTRNPAPMLLLWACSRCKFQQVTPAEFVIRRRFLLS